MVRSKRLALALGTVVTAAAMGCRVAFYGLHHPDQLHLVRVIFEGLTAVGLAAMTLGSWRRRA